MITPKEKRERALGERLGLKGERCSSPKCAAVRKPYRPGMHGQKRQRALSEFGRQIREKQKFKLSYGVDERTLRRVFQEASRKSGSTTEKILELLERRLDNVLFRLGFTLSRSAARQLIIHGHIAVNGRRVASPGLLVSKDDRIAIYEGSKTKGMFKQLPERLKKYEPPAWLHIDKDVLEGRVLSLPKDTTPPFEISLLVESFSK